MLWLIYGSYSEGERDTVVHILDIFLVFFTQLYFLNWSKGNVRAALSHCRQNVVSTINTIFYSLLTFHQEGVTYGSEILQSVLSKQNISPRTML
jgi:hypothetical protein